MSDLLLRSIAAGFANDLYIGMLRSESFLDNMTEAEFVKLYVYYMDYAFEIAWNNFLNTGEPL